jgi:hypothetical protein
MVADVERRGTDLVRGVISERVVSARVPVRVHPLIRSTRLSPLVEALHLLRVRES